MGVVKISSYIIVNITPVSLEYARVGMAAQIGCSNVICYFTIECQHMQI